MVHKYTTKKGVLIMANKNNHNGTLILKEIKFEQVLKRKVMRSDKVGKIYLPKNLIGKEVYVVIEEEEK